MIGRRTHRRLFTGAVAAALLAASAVLPPAASAAEPHPAVVTDPASLVNTFIGTTGNPDQPWGGQGNTFPGAQAPFGMLAWGPDTPSRPSGGGYNDADSSITGFSLTHVNGPGCDGLAGDVPFLPISGNLPDAAKLGSVAVPFEHSSQSTTPGSYTVTAGGVKTQLVTSQRAGLASFTYPAGQAARLLLKTGGGSALGDLAADVAIVGDREITGTVRPGKFCGGSPTYDLHFSVVFDQPFATMGTWTGTTTSDGSRTASGTESGAYVSFTPGGSGTVLAKVGISYVDVAGATANYQAEIPGWSTGDLATATHDDWNTYLNRIQIGGGTADEQHVFYTSLYRAFESPNVFDDADGRYLGFDEKVHTVAPGRHFYTTFSGWDTYRTEQPLLAWLAPKEASDMMQSMVDAAQQSPSKSLPHWTIANHDGFVMPGDPSAAIVASSYALGARNFDAGTALDLLIAQSKREHTYTASTDASTVLEYASADFASAQLATALGRDSDASTLMSTAAQWVSRLDPATGYLRPLTSEGLFTKAFSPKDTTGMVEGTVAQYRFSAPLTFPAMINAAGGAQATVAALDTFFTEVNGGLDTPYAWMGNEPGLATPYAYLQAGAPTHTQQVLSRIRTQLYTNTPNGIRGGNDDLGSMSSWYVFAALGVSPQGPGLGNLLISNPLFPYAVVRRAAGDMTISAPNTTPGGTYIQSMTVNGAAYPKTYLPQAVALGGAQLDITMGADAATTWGTAAADAPPADTDQQPSVAAGVTPESDSATLTPGSSQKFAFTVADLEGQDQTVSWTATTPDGLTITPASGQLSIAAHGKAAADITATSTSTAGTFPVTLKVSGTDGSTFTRSLLLKVTRPGGTPNGFIDDFEGYGNDAALQAAYSYNHASADQLTLDKSVASQGTYGARFSYDFSAEDYSGVGKTFTPDQDWSGFTEIDAHLVPDGSNQKLVLQFTAGGSTFEAYPSLAGTDPVGLKVPFADFQDKAGSHPAPTAAQLKSVSQFWVYINKTDSYAKPSSIGLDDIRATGAATPPGGGGGLTDPNAGALLGVLDSVSTSRDDHPGEANLAGGGSSYSRDALAAAGLVAGQPVKADGVILTWPDVPPGTPDSVQVNGQTIKITGAKGASKLGVLGAGVYACNGTSGTATLTYTDGTSATAKLALGDWTRCGGGAAILDGNTIVAATNYRNTTTSSGDPVKTFLFADSIPLDASKQLQSVTLPKTVTDGQVYVFGIGTDAPVAAQAMTNVKPPTISGEGRVGATLTAMPGTWSEPSPTLAYQWTRNGAPITGATAATYPVTAADAGRSVAVTVTASAAGFTPASATSNSIAIGKLTSTTSGSVSPAVAMSTRPVTYIAQVTADGVGATGTVIVLDQGVVLATASLPAAGGRVAISMPRLRPGFHRLTAQYSGSDQLLASTAAPVQVFVR